MNEENLISQTESEEKLDEDNSDFIHTEKDNNNERETKDSIQIHEIPNISDINEEYTEKCYSMKEGSILGGVFALSSIALGNGAFSIPIGCTQLGCVWYILLLFIGAISSYWTLKGLIKSSRKPITP